MTEPARPTCRYCGADCSDGRSWDGGDLYACPPCADARAARNREHRDSPFRGPTFELHIARLWLARREEQIDKAKALHHTATPRHALCVTCGERWPCPTWEALNDG